MAWDHWLAIGLQTLSLLAALYKIHVTMVTQIAVLREAVENITQRMERTENRVDMLYITRHPEGVGE